MVRFTTSLIGLVLRYRRGMTILPLICMSTACSASAEGVPSDAANRERYRIVFSDEFDSLDTIGADPDHAPQAKWYRNFFFGHPTTLASALQVKDGVLIMQPDENEGANLITAAPTSNALGWAGRVFRRGAYFEARIALGPDMRDNPRYWPTFWLMSIEHMAQKGAAQWLGQTGDFRRFAESDIFEYNPDWTTLGYYASMNEWYGRWSACKDKQWCRRSNQEDPRRLILYNPANSKQEFHVYGQLWVSASEGREGYVQNYFDGRPVGARETWTVGEPLPPASSPLLYNVIDRQGQVLMLTTGKQRMSVDWVRVWQLPSGEVERRLPE